MITPGSKPFGTRLREWRESRQMTLDELGRLVGVDRMTVWRWETKGKLPARQKDLVQLAHVMGLKVEEVLYGQGGRPPVSPELAKFFRTEDGSRLTEEERLGLQLLLGSSPVDEGRIKSALYLLGVILPKSP